MASSNHVSHRLSPERLEGIFAALGVDDPASWVESEVKEGIPQLTGLLFLRSAWQLVIGETDQRWIDSRVEDAKLRPTDTYSGIGHALQRMLALGVQREDVIDVVRGMQAELLFSLLYLMADPGKMRDAVPDSMWSEVQHIGWELFETSDNGEPARSLSGLHESVLATDPTGREMRPRGAPAGV